MISDALVVSSGRDPHWDESAKNLIEGLMIHVATSDAHKGVHNLVKVREMLTRGLQKDKEEQLRDEMRKNGDENANLDAGIAILNTVSDYFYKPEREKGSVLSTALRHTKFLDYGMIKRVLTGHDFDLSELKSRKDGVSVYLCLPMSRMGSCKRWLRIFVNLLIHAMESTKGRVERPVLMVLDEFPILGYMEQVENAAGQIAGYGMKIWTIIQDINQLKSIYKDRWETFIGNCGLMQFFGNTDVSTCEYVSKIMGQTTYENVSGSESLSPNKTNNIKGFNYGFSTNKSITTIPLLRPDEVAYWFSRERQNQIVMIPDRQPIKINRGQYFEHPLFRKRADF